MQLPKEVMLRGKRDSRIEIYRGLKGRMRMSLQRIQKVGERSQKDTVLLKPREDIISKYKKWLTL